MDPCLYDISYGYMSDGNSDRIMQGVGNATLTTDLFPNTNF